MSEEQEKLIGEAKVAIQALEEQQADIYAKLIQKLEFDPGTRIDNLLFDYIHNSGGESFGEYINTMNQYFERY